MELLALATAPDGSPLDVTELKYRWRRRRGGARSARAAALGHRVAGLLPLVGLPAAAEPVRAFGRRFTGGADRRGTARLILGLGLPPGSRQCAVLLERINAQDGFFATDVSDIDLAQERRSSDTPAACAAGRRRQGSCARRF